MLRRIAVVTVFCAALVPFGGSASASCTDDLQQDLRAGFDPGWQGSPYFLNWVHTEGTATVVVEGDALIYDVDAAADWATYNAETMAGNVPDAALSFVDCVAG